MPSAPDSESSEKKVPKKTFFGELIQKLHGQKHEDLAVLQEALTEKNSAEQLNAICELLGITSDELSCENRTGYLKNPRWKMIYRLFWFRSQATDDRMGIRKDSTPEQNVKSSVHLPDQSKEINVDPRIPQSLVRAVFSCERSSWTFLHSKIAKISWIAAQLNLVKIVREAKNQREFVKKYSEMLEGIEEERDKAIDVYAEISGVSKENVMIAGSGANAILAYAEMLFPGMGEQMLWTTKENGSELVNAKKNLKEDTIGLREDDPENQSFNNEVDHDKVAQGYIDGIALGKRVISFTLCSKTGVRYDIPQEGKTKSALDLVIEAVKKHNEDEKNKNDQVYLIADAVQLAGRIPQKELISIITRPEFVAGVHTTSKFCGGIPHVGFGVESEQGKKILDGKTERISKEKLSEYQVVYHGGSKEVVKDPLVDLRVPDNSNALKSVEDLRNYEDFEFVIHGLRNMYMDVFKKFGFRIFRGDTPTLIAMEPPLSGNYKMDLDKIDPIFLTKLAENDISLGGFLKENAVPIIRMSISAELVRIVLEKKIDLASPLMKRVFKEFENRIKFSIKKTQDYVPVAA